MTKDIVQDIIPPPKRSIRNIPISNKKLKEDNPSNNNGGNIFVDKKLNEREPLKPRESKGNGPGIKTWIFTIILLILIIIVFLHVFSGAKVRVVPVQERITIDSVFSAQSGINDDNLNFETITLNRNSGIIVPATESEYIERRASGRITIINNHSEEDQRLITNTRFESPEGLIYRIDEPIVVPGKTGNNPGRIQAVVYADEPGEEHNIGITEFTIPGFAGDPRFETFSAESVTEMTGGFSGDVKMVSENILIETEGELEVTLREFLISNIKNQISKDYILYDDAIIFSLKELPQSDITEDSVRINREGVVTAIVFNKNELGNHISRNITEDEEVDVNVLKLDKATFALMDKDTLSPESIDFIRFNLRGELIFVWNFDEEELKDNLKGVLKKDLEQILRDYGTIDRAEVIIRPFWKRSFPKNIDKIKLEKILIK